MLRRVLFATVVSVSFFAFSTTASGQDMPVVVELDIAKIPIQDGLDATNPDAPKATKRKVVAYRGVVFVPYSMTGKTGTTIVGYDKHENERMRRDFPRQRFLQDITVDAKKKDLAFHADHSNRMVVPWSQLTTETVSFGRDQVKTPTARKRDANEELLKNFRANYRPGSPQAAKLKSLLGKSGLTEADVERILGTELLEDPNMEQAAKKLKELDLENALGGLQGVLGGKGSGNRGGSNKLQKGQIDQYLKKLKGFGNGKDPFKGKGGKESDLLKMLNKTLKK